MSEALLCLQANAVHLAAQLPEVWSGSGRILYPASAKAGSDLQVRTRSALCRTRFAPAVVEVKLVCVPTPGRMG